MAVLNRRPKSGFVLYPKQAEKRIIDGTARFRTRCDVLVGPCACGAVHQEDDPWVQSLLRDNNYSIEPFVLHSINGSVKIPRYWVKPQHHQRCNILHGPCSCGSRHTVNERWVQDLLMAHHAIVENIHCESDIIDTDPHFMEDEGINCNCDSCRRRHSENPRKILNIKDI